MKVYLAGNVKNKSYREYTLKNYSNKLNLFDPLREIDEKAIPINFDWEDYHNNKIELPDHCVHKLVSSDKIAITKCDILVAYIENYSAGTIMEIKHAYDHRVPVFIIDPTKRFRKDIWLRFHTIKFMDSIDECFKYILKLKENDMRFKNVLYG